MRIMSCCTILLCCMPAPTLADSQVGMQSDEIFRIGLSRAAEHGRIIDLARMILVQCEVRCHQGDKAPKPALTAAAKSLPLAERMALGEELSPQACLGFIPLVKSYLDVATKGRFPDVSVDTITKWQRRRTTNEVKLDTDQWTQDEPGKGIFPAMSLINHSCDPTCYWPNSGPVVNVRARRDIARGEEITINYVPLMLTTHDRRDLLTNYGFRCRCITCSDSDNSVDGVSLRDRQMIGYRCDAPCHGLLAWNGTRTPRSVTCPECAREWNGQELRERLDVVEGLLNKYKILPNVTTEMQNKLFRLLDDGFAPHNVHKVRFASALLRPDTPPKNLIVAIRRVVDIAHYFDDELVSLNPELALLVTQSKVKGVGDLEALRKLKYRARDILGDTHPFYLMVAREC